MTMSSRRARGVVIVGAALAVALGACSGSKGNHAAPPGPQPTAGAVSSSSTAAATTVPGSPTTTQTTVPQTSGPRTILSPIGLNVRSQPAKTAPVLGTAAQGAVLTVLAHSTATGGWFQVKGATVTGWISDSPTLSAQGKFGNYTAGTGQFGALYPATWTTAVSPPASVVFRAPSGAETIVVTTAATVALLGAGRAGYSPSTSEQVVACGVTTFLRSYTKLAAPATPAVTTPAAATPAGTSPAAAAPAAPQQNLVQVRITLDPQHALGIDANLTDLGQLQTVRDFVNSVTFPYPQCQH